MAKAPKRIGRYKVVDEIGRGAMGVVYKAQDPALDRAVALKTIAFGDDAEGRKEYQKRFVLEAKAAGKLTHPNIVTVHDFGDEDDFAYMAMELVEGMDLRTRLREGAIPVADALDIALQVAEGLGFAHEHGVIHRDIKPGNIMIPERGPVKIMDFGIARVRSADHRTTTGQVLGTPRFMSPEQITGQPVDQRSDLFSLGVVLHEMLTGTPLFAGQDQTQIAHHVTSIEPVPPSRVNPEVPPMLDFVVARALKKDPAVRYQDAYAMCADLRDALAEMKAAAPRREADATRTLKLDPSAAEWASPAPAAGAIGADTRLPLARRFDAAAALQRLRNPSRSERARFGRAPRGVGLLRRLRRDAGPRLFAIVTLLAAGAAGYIAFA